MQHFARLLCTLLGVLPAAAQSPGGSSNAMYWAAFDRIQRADLDGSDIDTVLAAQLVSPVALTLDLVNAGLYCSDANTRETAQPSIWISRWARERGAIRAVVVGRNAAVPDNIVGARPGCDLQGRGDRRYGSLTRFGSAGPTLLGGQRIGSR